MKGHAHALRGFSFALFLLLVGAMLFQQAVLSGVNHDEQQFIAPPVLVAHDGAMPYRDFALLHMPNLVFAYAFLDRLTPWHFLAARLFSAACAWAIAALVFFSCHVLLAKFRAVPRFVLAAGFTLLLVCSSLWMHTAARAWNHSSALLPVVAAFTAFILAARGEKPGGWLFASGLCVGLALGTRLTFAPVVAPFGLAVLLLPHCTWQRRFASAAWFSLGVFVAVLPAMYFLGAHHEQFLYGNVESQRLRLLDPSDERAHKTITVWRKLRYFAKEIVRDDHPLFLAFFAVGVPGIVQHFRRTWSAGTKATAPWSGAILLTLLIPFLFAGAMAPTRFQPQHWFSLVPFLVIGACFGLTQWKSPRDKAAVAFTTLLFIGGIALTFGESRTLARPRAFTQWVPVKAHRFGVEIAGLAARGKVLTLAPLYPLEGGSTIYRELAVGPFAYRLAHLLPPGKRARVRVIAPADLPALLKGERPSAILLGAEPDEQESALREYASEHRFERVRNFGRLHLWLPAPVSLLASPEKPVPP